MGKELRSTNSVDRNSNATKGFASNSPVQQKYVSSKGGRVKTKKGLGAMPPDKATEIQRLGGLKRQQKLREEQKTQNQDVVSTTQQMPSFSKDMDSYIPSEQNDDSQMAIPSQQYNDMRPSMPPMAPPEEASETAASTATTASTVSTDSD